MLRDPTQHGASIAQFVPVPVGTADEIGSAIAGIERGELVVVALHGWFSVETGDLMLATRDDEPGIGLREAVRAAGGGRIAPAALILDCCTGLETQKYAWGDGLLPCLQGAFDDRSAVLANFGRVDFADRFALTALEHVISFSEGGDADTAFNVLDAAVYNHSKYSKRASWFPFMVSPDS